MCYVRGHCIYYLPLEEEKNLPKDTTGQGPQLITYFDQRAKVRYQVIQVIAKSTDQFKYMIQMNIHISKNNDLL